MQPDTGAAGASAARNPTAARALIALLPRLAGALRGEPAARAAWTVALSAGRQDLLELASWRELSADSEAAIALVRAAVAIDPGDHHAPAYLASLLAAAGRCQEAEAALRSAELRTRSATQRERCGWIAQARQALGSCPPVATTAAR